MTDYRKTYTVLFNDVTEAIALLKGAQVKSEEIFVSGDDGVVLFARFPHILFQPTIDNLDIRAKHRIAFRLHVG